MVQLDRILSERSDERIIQSVKGLPDQGFCALVDRVLGCLELRVARSRARETFVVADCEHRPDSKKYTVFFSRREEPIGQDDVGSLLSYMEKTAAASALVFTTGDITPEGESLLRDKGIGYADGAKLAALLRSFDLDKEISARAEPKAEDAVAAHPQAVRLAGDRLEAAMASGYDALSAKDYMRALEAFDLAIFLDDTYDVPWRMKGNTLDEMGYHEQALECYKRALELLPEGDETWFSLGNCFYSLGRYSEEIMCYDRALFYDPSMQKALVNKGSTLHRLGRYAEALETYDKLLKINYRLEKVHNNKGATLHAMGRSQDALESYNRAIELKGDYIEAWMNKGNLLYELGRQEEALDSFTKVTQLRPELPKGWYLRGMASRKLGNSTQAKASFEQALRADPDYVEARKALDEESKRVADKYAEVPRIVEDIFARKSPAPVPEPSMPREAPLAPVMAEDVVARVQDQKIDELAEELYGDRAELLLLLGRFDEAFEFLGKSLRLEGENAPLLNAAGSVLYKQGKTEAAVRSFEHAVSADPGNVPALMNLQVSLMDAGDWDRARKVSDAMRGSEAGWQVHAMAALEARHRKDFPRAIECVENAVAAESLAMLLNYQGILRLESEDVDGAGESFEHARSKPFDPSEAHNNVGVALFKKGDLDTASVEFDKAIKVTKSNAAAWNNRGCVLYKKDRIREAVACFEESVLISPSTVALNNKGFSQLTMDSLPESLSSYNKSLGLAETAEAYNDKGIVLLRMGDIEGAKVAFKEALRIAPQFKDAGSNLKRAESLRPTSTSAEPRSGPDAPPSLEVVGGKGESSVKLSELTLQNLRKMRKTELEAICDALDVSPRGTKTELINRVLRARKQLQRK